MQYIEAPERTQTSLKSLFLAGSITGSKPWQDYVIDKLKDLDIAVYNPRRKNFDVDDPSMTEEQIKWEFDYRMKADAMSFWFAKKTPAPITLYELGVHSMIARPIVIGIDPEYSRKEDVEKQTKLIRPEVTIVYSLDSLVDVIFKMMEQVQFI